MITKGDGWYKDQVGAGICKLFFVCKINYILNIVWNSISEGGVPFLFNFMPEGKKNFVKIC